MNRKLMFATGNDVLPTPWPFFHALNEEFRFVIDVAATRRNRKVPAYYGPDHKNHALRDCLVIDWPTDGPCFLNPIYSEPERACRPRCKKKRCRKRRYHIDADRPGCYDFVRKAAEQRRLGVTTVCLLASRTDNAWFHDFIWDARRHRCRPGVAVRFVKGRLVFEGKNSAPFPSVVVIFRGRRATR